MPAAHFNPDDPPPSEQRAAGRDLSGPPAEVWRLLDDPLAGGGCIRRPHDVAPIGRALAAVVADPELEMSISAVMVDLAASTGVDAAVRVREWAHGAVAQRDASPEDLLALIIGALVERANRPPPPEPREESS